MFRRSAVHLTTSEMAASIKTFAFFDLETTGLPSEENNKTKITELTLVAVQEAHLRSGVFPRIQNKLSLCFHPQRMISSMSEKITGLSNHALENQAPFTSSTVQMINRFLDHNPRPLCLVAHNGNRFDYPILRAEVEKTGENLLDNILCIDSLEMFRELHTVEPKAPQPVDSPDSVLPLEFSDGFDEVLCKALDEYENDVRTSGVKRALEVQKINETTPKRQQISHNVSKQGKQEGSRGHVNSRKQLNFGVSFKLGDVYTRLTNEEIRSAHQAEGDVMMLMMCAVALGDKFVDWANERARRLSDVPVMRPGQRIGT